MSNIPPTRPAANKRSPNRQPRWRKPLRDWLREQEWELFLKVYRVVGYDKAARAITAPCDDPHYMDEAIRNTKHRLMAYAHQPGHEDENRIGQWGEAKKQFQENIEPRLGAMTESALTVVETLLESENPKLKALQLDAAKTHLKGTGIYSDKSKVEVDADVKVDFVIGKGYKEKDGNSDKGN